MSTQPLHTTQIDQLPVSIYASNEALGAAAAAEAADIIIAKQRRVMSVMASILHPAMDAHCPAREGKGRNQANSSWARPTRSRTRTPFGQSTEHVEQSAQRMDRTSSGSSRKRSRAMGNCP